MELPQVDWTTAEVQDGVLTVSIAGELPKGWKDTFRRTTQLLGHAHGEDIEIKGNRVVVRGVAPDGEENLRVLLEGAVQESNAAHPPAEPEGDAKEDAAGDSEDDTERDDADTRMTERFRGFGGETE